MSLIHGTATELVKLRKKIEAMPSAIQQMIHEEAQKLYDRTKPKVEEPEDEMDDCDVVPVEQESKPTGFEEVI